MSLPFDVRQFLEVFARYNTAVWPAQVVLELAGICAVGFAIHGRPSATRVVGIILGSLWMWAGWVYHLVFFRSINPAAGLFGVLFLIEGLLLFVLLGWRQAVRFSWTRDTAGRVGAGLASYALAIYPVLGYVLGHRYPAAPTFGLPCPTTILTLGILAWARPRPWALLAIPLLWSAVGASAALQLGMWEDLGLVAAGAMTLALHFTSRTHREAPA